MRRMRDFSRGSPPYMQFATNQIKARSSASKVGCMFCAAQRPDNRYLRVRFRGTGLRSGPLLRADEGSITTHHLTSVPVLSNMLGGTLLGLFQIYDSRILDEPCECEYDRDQDGLTDNRPNVQVQPKGGMHTVRVEGAIAMTTDCQDREFDGVIGQLGLLLVYDILVQNYKR